LLITGLKNISFHGSEGVNGHLFPIKNCVCGIGIMVDVSETNSINVNTIYFPFSINNEAIDHKALT
jgi:hypothetical protein